MRLMIVGDFCPTPITEPALDAGDKTALMGDTLDIIAQCDFAIANLECALTDSENRIRKCGPNLKGKPSYAGVLRDCGFTHVGMSNNHVLDFGVEGMRDTAANANAAGLISFGYGENDQDSRKPLFIEKDGQRVAVIAVCEHEYSYALPDRFGANPFDPFDTMEDITNAKKQADYVVVMYHGGKEQCEYPSDRLRKACRAMVRAGADIVITQHSHCVGCHEDYMGGQIVYGEGNFNFVEESDNPQLRSGLMMDVTFDDRTRITYIPVVTTGTGITTAKGDDRRTLLDDFEKRSRILLDDKKWQEAWTAFCVSKLETYIPAAANAFKDIPDGENVRQVFPHYLDCEAHLDVWKTVFKTWHADKTSGA